MQVLCFVSPCAILPVQCACAADAHAASEGAELLWVQASCTRSMDLGSSTLLGMLAAMTCRSTSACTRVLLIGQALHCQQDLTVLPLGRRGLLTQAWQQLCQQPVRTHSTLAGKRTAHRLADCCFKGPCRFNFTCTQGSTVEEHLFQVCSETRRQALQRPCQGLIWQQHQHLPGLDHASPRGPFRNALGGSWTVQRLPGKDKIGRQL